MELENIFKKLKQFEKWSVILLALCIFIYVITFIILGNNSNTKNTTNKTIINIIEPYSSKDVIDLIDVVYTWVDTYDPERDEYKKQYNLHINTKDENTSKKRYEDNQELKYSLRSVEKYCQWVNMIYIVVKDGQYPKFIDFNNSKIKLINHSELIPPNALPTFNSNAIELCIHKIPNLSAKYLYFNDDFFVNKPLLANDLYNGNVPNIILKDYKQFHGKVKMPNMILNNSQMPYIFLRSYLNTLYHANTILDTNIRISLPHIPSICYKPWEEEIENLLKQNNLWDATVSSKFRKNENIVINNGFRTLYYLKKGAGILNWEDRTLKLNNDKCFYRLKTNDKFFAVNEISDGCISKYVYQMEIMYPDKSKFEL
jgi:hypothetical protein